MGDTLKSYWDDKRHPLDPLENLDKSKGGIPATSEVKNKDRVIILDPQEPWSRSFIDRMLESLAELKLGYIRTLTVIRKGAGQ